MISEALQKILKFGTWRGKPVQPAYGGTGQSSYPVGGLLYAVSETELASLAPTTDGEVVTLVGGLPAYAAAAGGGTGITRTIVSTAVNAAIAAAAGTDYVYNATASGITLTMPTAVGNSNHYTIVNSSAAPILLASTSGQTFGGTASPISIAAGASYGFVSDGTNWMIL